ncbi:hypothetical protein WKS79_000466 [Providencia stuartii]|uniref:hypothetical protein n=1 Tax=Providencia stuartii TaxID=588 RepID=UPI00076B8771|nr:hypothetical protein [Providencia stuartii]AMG66433.1 hypothetical protein AL507_07470 [Providencia stuartii]
MNIKPGIEWISTAECQYHKFSPIWDFGGNSSVISLCTGSSNMIEKSGHWITEESDVFYFDKNNLLSNIQLSLPNENEPFIVNNNYITNFGYIILKDDTYDIIPVQTMRYFDPTNRILFAFNKKITSKDSFEFSMLHSDLGLISINGEYNGYVLLNPLNYFTDSENHFDKSNLPDDSEYHLISTYLNIMSDNRINQLNGDISMVVNELKESIIPNINLIKSKVRKKIVISSINELLEFYT